MRREAFRKKISEEGLTLVELLVYAVVFTFSAVFLVSILTSVTRSQLRQSSLNEVNQQISFVASTIQRLVRESSLVENPAGTASSTLFLRTSTSSTDPTKIYADASSTVIYLEQGSNPAIALTNDKVNVPSFSVTKYENPGGSAVVQVDFTLEANTTNPLAKISRSWRGAISRVSAATFDSSLLPSGSGLNVGGSASQWQSGYFSNDLTVLGKIGAGIDPSGTTMKIKSAGNIGFTTSTYGVILMAPNGNCLRVGISNTYQFTTSTATCP